MSKKIAVLVTNFVQDDELKFPLDKLKEDGHEVTLINTTTDDIAAIAGTKFKIDKTIDSIVP